MCLYSGRLILAQILVFAIELTECRHIYIKCRTEQNLMIRHWNKNILSCLIIKAFCLPQDKIFVTLILNNFNNHNMPYLKELVYLK